MLYTYVKNLLCYYSAAALGEGSHRGPIGNVDCIGLRSGNVCHLSKYHQKIPLPHTFAYLQLYCLEATDAFGLVPTFAFYTTEESIDYMNHVNIPIVTHL